MNIWDQLVDCICRPPRDVYSAHELLGGLNQTFLIGQMECTRIDFELTNKRGLKLMCSHYLPLDAKSEDGKLPVVVYCHCNSGSRRDAEEAVYHLLPCGVGVVAFDFTGSGLSDGKWVTLGANEVEDLAVVVQHLRAQGGISSIGLWGRSMGAVTALLYSHLDPDIAGMVLDSPFSRLTDLMLEIVVSQRLPIPKMMLKLALRLMRNSVRRKAGADINTVSPLDVVTRAVIPAMFGHGEEDSFIGIQHSVKLYEAYNSAGAVPVYKNLVRFKGDHNHPRPSFFYSSVCCFFHQQLKLDQVLLGGNPADTQQLMKYGSLTLSAAHDSLDRANGFINTPWSLEPVTSMTPEDHAAAAAAAAALLNDEAAASPRSGGGAGSSSSSSGGAGLTGTACARLAVPSSRHTMIQGGSSSHGQAGGGGGGTGVVHISEGGLNSPRASAARERGRQLIDIDAGASSSASNGGMGHLSGVVQGSMDQQQLSPSRGPSSPISPVHHHQQQQQHGHMRQQQHHHHFHPHHRGDRDRHVQLWQPSHNSSGSSRGVPGQGTDRAGQGQAGREQQLLSERQEVSWWLPAAAAGAAAAAAAASNDQLAGTTSHGELFSIGSRGAPADIRGQPAPAAAPAPACDPNAAAAAAAAAAADHVAGKGSFKRLFKRNSSSGSASTTPPSTSPPAAADSESGLWRPKSGGSGLGSSQQAGAAAAAGSAAVLPPSNQQHFHQDSLQQQQQQQQQQQRGVQPEAAVSGVAAMSAAGLTAGNGWGPGLLAADTVDEAAFLDADLAAAIAASLADQQQPEALVRQQQQQPPVGLGVQLHSQQRQHSTRRPHSLEEEELMLREAIALSLCLADTTQQPAEASSPPRPLQQQPLPLQPAVVGAATHQEELFSIGSRGAAVDVRGQPSPTAAPALARDQLAAMNQPRVPVQIGQINNSSSQAQQPESLAPGSSNHPA